jgi:hypothetical protein
MIMVKVHHTTHIILIYNPTHIIIFLLFFHNQTETFINNEWKPLNANDVITLLSSVVYISEEIQMAKYGAVTFIFIFVSIFALLAIVITGLASQDQNDTTNLSDTQDTQQIQKETNLELQGRAIWGMSKLQIGLIILGVLIAIGVFLKVLMGKRSF